jgi:signal peptidase I
MEPYCHAGDILWANRWAGREYGSVVIFENPHPKATRPADEKDILLKRVAGFAGDRFYWTGHTLWRESGGTAAAIHTVLHVEPTPANNFKTDIWHDILLQSEIFSIGTLEFIVPSGHVFVLGDNYEVSWDSRYFGAVPESKVLGVVRKSFL